MSSIIPSALVIEPSGGLCNRMRVLDSAIAFSKEACRDLYVVWMRDSTLNCRFQDLFLVPKCFKKVIQVHAGRKLEVLAKSAIRRLFAAYGKFLECGAENWRFHDTFRTQFASQHGLIYVATFYRLPYGSRHYADFEVAEHVQRTIDSYVTSFDNVVGVHVRRTDSVKSIEHSPTSGFVECMRREVDEDPHVRFFLATDSPDVEQHMKDAFPTRIITHPKTSLDRGDPAAIQDALVDLYCLAKTRKLIGSYWSSFTDAASEIGKMETVVVGKSAATMVTS